MKTSQRGINDLILSEGLETKAYKDSVGVWTIGVGHTAAAGPPAPKAGMTITRQEAIDLLAKDLGKYEATVNRVLPDVPQHVFDGAVSFHFNTGSIAKATWPKLYKAGKLKEAKSSFLTWNKPPEIMKRRKREASLIFDGIYATKAVAEPQGAPQAAPVPDPAPVPPPPAAEPPVAAPESSTGIAPSTAAKAGVVATFIAAAGGWWTFGIVAVLAIAVVAYLVYRNRK